MSKTLLLADDSVVIQKLVGLSFANEDVVIIATDNGDDAVTRAREVNPDIVLADVVMPGKSGYEVCEAIKQDRDLAHVPVLLLTGTFEAFDEARAAAAGANGQITKPFEAQSLVERVNSVMAEAAAGPPTIESSVAEAAAAESPAEAHSLAVGTASVGSAGDAAARAEAAPPNEATGYGRRITDAEPNKAGLEVSGHDVSESDFFDDQLTPQLDVDALDSDLDADLDATEDDQDEILLNSPGLESSQDLDADFSDSPLAPYAQATTAERAPHAEDATVVSLPPITRPAAAIPGTDKRAGLDSGRERSAYGESATEDATAIAQGVGLAEDMDLDDGLGLEDSLPLPEALTPPPIDLDADLGGPLDPNADDDSQGAIAEATILVGENDINATTSPSIAIPMDAPVGPPGADDLGLGASGLEDLGDSHSGRSASEALTIHTPSERIDQDAAVAPTPDEQFRPSRESGVADLDASLEDESADALGIAGTGPDSYSVSAAEAQPSEPNPLDFGPTSVGGEDLDFAFDVSEQRAVSEAEALEEDSLASMDDVSESQLIGRDTSEVAAPAASLEETRVGDYDVSSSDLATAISISPAAESEADEQDGVEVSDSVASPFFSQLASPISSGHYAVGLDSAEPKGRDESRPESEAAREDGFGTDTRTPAFAPEPVETGADPEIGSGLDLGSNAADDRRVSDLSPLMEQRIQETLEKVAWEAFSDLSETIVKQVISRVEQVAWDVIPEMAETLVREEIRRMKGEDD